MTEGKPLSYPPRVWLSPSLDEEGTIYPVPQFDFLLPYISLTEVQALIAEVDASVTAKCMDRVAEARAAAFEEAAKLLDAEQGTWLPNAPFGSAICAALKEYAKKIRAGGGE